MSTEVHTPEETRDELVEQVSEDTTLDELLPRLANKHRASPKDWENFKQEVKVRSRLEDIIHADWERRSSTDWWCGSPLRPGDSDPSFHINPERQVWKDFGLGDKGGDVFAYLQRLWNCSFFEALKRRAAELNIPLPSSAPLTEREQAEVNERELVQTILTRAAEHYHQSLPAEMRDYLTHHYGFTDATIDMLKIGFDDVSLYWQLKDEGNSDYDMALTGLFGNIEKDQTRFQGRITFPYWRAGKVVYFAARQTKDTPAFIKGDKDVTPKYLKLKTGPTGDELSWVSRTVTNEHFWGEDCAGRRLDLLLIAEGMPDAISAHQAGFNVISPVTVQFREKDHAKLAAVRALLPGGGRRVEFRRGRSE
jgi:DNA primase